TFDQRASARSQLKCVETPTGLGHNQGTKSSLARSRVRKGLILKGEMSEGLKEPAWKACVGETLPWVRIPLSPPSLEGVFLNCPQSTTSARRSTRDRLVWRVCVAHRSFRGLERGR